MEIRLQWSALLLIGRPGELPKTVVRAGDQLRLRAAIARLPLDRFALQDLRRQWPRFMPGISTEMLGHIDLVAQLTRMLRNRQLAAALLYDNGAEISAARLEAPKPQVIRLPYPGGMLLVGGPAALPGSGRGPNDKDAAAAILNNLARSRDGLKPLEVGWNAVFGNAPRATGAALQQRVARGLADGSIAVQVLTGASGVAAAARRPDAPRPIGQWSRLEKIAEAIPRSGQFLSGDLKAFVETFRDPMVAAQMAAGMAALLALQTVPVVGAAIDTAILVTLAWTIGWEAGTCIDALVRATITAVDAKDEADLDRAARLYANAFKAMGAAALSALAARFMLRTRGAAAAKTAEREAAEASASRSPQPRQDRAPSERLSDPQKNKAPAKIAGAASKVVSKSEATEYLTARGVPRSTAEAYVDSFEGPITLRPVKQGDAFLRYGDDPAGKGSFITKTRYASPEEAAEGLYLKPYGNKASLIQEVTASKDTFVLEGGIKGGNPPGALQSVITDRTAFSFGAGRGF